MSANGNKKQKTTGKVHLWLRSEVKPQEGRTPLTPDNVKELLATSQFAVTVERSTDRCFSDKEYEEAGATIVDARSWEKPGVAPSDAIVFGLKELPDDIGPLSHTHIFFGHCFKGQFGWRELLEKFHQGKGKLYDLEFLTNPQGRRVAAFGRPAGLVGCALGLLTWANQQKDLANRHPLGTTGVKPWKTEKELFAQVADAIKAVGRKVRVLVIGALGRCGGGATYTCEQIPGDLVSVTGWDLDETKNGGPFVEAIEKNDVLVNCVYLTQKIPPFVDNEALDKAGDNRALSVVVDVSCDYTSENNPLPIYDRATTVFDPVLRVREKDDRNALPLDVISIDHLPSLLPRESSENYAEQLFPYIKELAADEQTDVWAKAEKIFSEKLEEAKLKPAIETDADKL